MCNSVNRIDIICDECCGYSESSQCCDAEVYNNKCCSCGKFTKSIPCDKCGGSGYLYFEEGQEVSLYVYQRSPDYIKNQFNKNFKKGHFYKGKLVSINTKTKEGTVKLSTRTIIVQLTELESY